MGSKFIVEAIPCKDCRYLKEVILVAGEIAGYCELHNHSFMFGGDFCSYGKPSEGKIVVDGETIRY